MPIKKKKIEIESVEIVEPVQVVENVQVVEPVQVVSKKKDEIEFVLVNGKIKTWVCPKCSHLGNTSLPVNCRRCGFRQI